ncbi:MAG: glutaredoxin family protein [Woeseiaceae bacterium]
MNTLRVYSRQGCHLCELLIEQLLPMVQGQFAVEVRDIDTRPDWRANFDLRVPVVEYQDRVISEYPLDRQAIATLLDSPS